MLFAAKKKKKPAKAAAEGEAAAPAVAAPEGGSGSGASAAAAPAATLTASAPLLSEDGEREESYEDMLSRVYTLLNEHNPELIGRCVWQQCSLPAAPCLWLPACPPFAHSQPLSSSQTHTLTPPASPPLLPGSEKRRLKPPAVSRVGTTRTAWTNFNEICVGMKRNPDHVLSFFLAELGTTGSIDGSARLLVRGKYQPKYIESLLRKYISEYVICAMCRNLDTELARDPVTRLWFMNCKACGSSRSVAAIKAGFHATAKGERKKARALLSS